MNIFVHILEEKWKSSENPSFSLINSFLSYNFQFDGIKRQKVDFSKVYASHKITNAQMKKCINMSELILPANKLSCSNKLHAGWVHYTVIWGKLIATWRCYQPMASIPDGWYIPPIDKGWSIVSYPWYYDHVCEKRRFTNFRSMPQSPTESFTKRGHQHTQIHSAKSKIS